jgi:hypothetical protein
MTLESFSDANKQLIEYKPLFNKVVKTVDIFDTEKSIFFKNSINKNSVLLICDFEGKVVFIDEALRQQTAGINHINESILDFLHQEDIPVVIEHLVHLLQGKSHSIAINARLITNDNQNFFSKWHVGYLRGLFYFYPIELPKFQEKVSETDLNSYDFKSQKSILPDQLLWKIEVSRILYEWDVLMFKQIKSCTNIVI